jgi:hypothetical protein
LALLLVLLVLLLLMMMTMFLDTVSLNQNVLWIDFRAIEKSLLPLSLLVVL